MNEVQWIGGGQVTEEQMRFFLSSATHDMIEEELSQLKHHKVSQPTPTIPISEDRDNLIYSQTREKDDDSVQFSHTALVDVKMTWAVFLYYMTNVKSYNELQWKEDYLRPMIPSWNKDGRMRQKRKFNQN